MNSLIALEVVKEMVAYGVFNALNSQTSGVTATKNVERWSTASKKVLHGVNMGKFRRKMLSNQKLKPKFEENNSRKNISFL